MTPVRLVLVALAAASVDQVTKQWALAALSPGQSVPVLPMFSLTLGYNEGASFGMLGGVMTGRPLLMVALTGAITAVLAWMAFRTRQRPEAAGWMLVVGGSLGNIIDRLRQGAVTDFLDFHWRGWHWPAFNLADVAIFCGVAVVLLLSLPRFAEKRDA